MATDQQIEDARNVVRRALLAADNANHAGEEAVLLMAASLEISSAWRPIETAPRDGTEVILHGPVPSDPQRVTAGFWIVPEPQVIGDCGGECRCPEYSDDVAPPRWCTMHGGAPGGWMSNDGGFTEEYPPTHWQPLPSLAGLRSPGVGVQTEEVG